MSSYIEDNVPHAIDISKEIPGKTIAPEDYFNAVADAIAALSCSADHDSSRPPEVELHLDPEGDISEQCKEMEQQLKQRLPNDTVIIDRSFTDIQENRPVLARLLERS